MMVQAEDVDDVLKTLYSWCVADQEYDHSGVHSVQKVDALIEAKMGSGFGGAQTRKWPTVMTTGCLGPYPATRLVSGVLTDVKLKELSTQYMVFQVDDLPPWYALNTPKKDTTTGVMVPGKKEEDKQKTGTKTAQLMTGGQAQSPAEGVPEVPGMVVGFVEKVKRLKDVLHERG
jgi:hypothetical protein